jgi:hypothetical protein
MATRYAFYFPDVSTTDNNVQEFTFTLNWFFKGHNNKLTSEISYLELEENDIMRPGWRFRFQWDVSF